MRIGFFDLVTHFGGAQRSTAQILTWIAQHAEVQVFEAYGVVPEFHATIARAPLRSEILLENPKVPTIGAKSRPLIRAVRAARALPELAVIARRLRTGLQRFQPHVLHVISMKALRVALFAVCGTDIPIVYWCRGRYLPEGAVQGIKSGKVVGAFCLTEECRDDAIRRAVSAERIHVIPNGIDVSRLRSVADTEVQLPGANHRIRLLLPATLVPGKGHACAIRGLARLVSAGCDAALYFAGSAPPESDSYLDQLKDLAEEEGVEDRVFPLGWRPDVAPLMRKCTAVVLPSRSEGMPRVVMEAIALQVPVAATPVGAIPDLLCQGMGGWLFDVDDYDALAREVSALHADPDRRKRTDLAFARLVNLHEPTRVVSKYIASCQRIISLRQA